MTDWTVNEVKVRFYNFSKKRNSTALPSSSYTEKDVAWKDETSTHDPSVICSGGPNSSWTYAHIPDWDKYYFVEDAVSMDLGRTEYILSEDAMGSHKTEINAQYAYIEYASSNIDKMIPDERLAMKQSRVIMGSGDVDTPILNSTGCYVLSVLNGITSCVGVASVYILDQVNMKKVANKLCDTSFAQAVNNFFNGDLLSGILGCLWVPFTMPTANVTAVWIGDQIITDVSAYALSDFAERQGSYQVPIFLRYGTNDFRSYEPYTTGTLYLPGAGNLELNMSDWYGSQNINISVTQEWTTGNCTYLLFHDNGALIQSVSCNVSSECPLGQIKSRYEEAGYSMIGAAGGIMMGSPVAAAAGIGSAILAFMRHSASIGGSIGGRGSVLWPYITHAEWSIDTEDPDAADRIGTIGGPVGEVDLIGNYTGYVKCRDASVAIAGSDRERQEIDAMVNAGFYNY